jgi:hypothetical protein
MMQEVRWMVYLAFCVFLLTLSVHADNQERIIIQTPFKPLKTVYPIYPEKLKKEGIAVRMRITIFMDRKGKVVRAMTHNCFYPELEEILEEAFIQWEFEPFIHKGEPIQISGVITIIFYPGELMSRVSKIESKVSPQVEPAASPNEELQMVLDKCTEYCLKLSESALYYICHEEVKEKFKNISMEQGVVLSMVGSPDLHPNEVMKTDNRILSLGGNEKNTYLYDYQLIKKDGKIDEKRILLDKDGKAVILENESQDMAPSLSLKPILVPVQIFGNEQRSKFVFRLADDERIQGKLAYVIEVFLRSGQTGYIRQGKIWMDKTDFRIVKIEIFSDFVEGFEYILKECRQYYLMPHFKSIHYYTIDKNGLLFPSQSEIRVEYSGLLFKKMDLKSEYKITYKDYRFFTVEWSHEEIKKKLEALFLYRDRLTFDYPAQLVPYVFRYFF